jgi:hypothetical protein
MKLRRGESSRGSSSISVSRSSSAPGRPYAKVMLYYEMRNKIAHVKLEAKRIDVAQIIADFYVIQDDLKP